MPRGDTVCGMTGYLWTARPHTKVHLHHLAGASDPATLARLASLGVGAGWRCLEVGAGVGTIANALAGLGAQVTATEVDLTVPEPAPGVSLIEHDITRDPLPEGEYDLVHARCVLMHLPQRREALASMVRALRPGGWLLVEDVDLRWRLPVLTAPDPAAGSLSDKIFETMVRLLTATGADGDWAASAYRALVDHGLTDVACAARLESWPSGSDGCEVLRMHTIQLREPILTIGLITADELDRWADLLQDKAFTIMSWMLIGTWGRRGR